MDVAGGGSVFVTVGVAVADGVDDGDGVAVLVGMTSVGVAVGLANVTGGDS